MKSFKMIVAYILILSSLLLASCIDGDAAKEHINSLFEAVQNEDFEKARSLLHPSIKDDVKAYFEAYEKQYNLDFSEGMEVIRYTSVQTSAYDSNVNGSQYYTAFEAKIGDINVKIEAQIVDNDEGYGIYALVVNTDEE